MARIRGVLALEQHGGLAPVHTLVGEEKALLKYTMGSDTIYVCNLLFLLNYFYNSVIEIFNFTLTPLLSV